MKKLIISLSLVLVLSATILGSVGCKNKTASSTDISKYVGKWSLSHAEVYFESEQAKKEFMDAQSYDQSKIDSAEEEFTNALKMAEGFYFELKEDMTYETNFFKLMTDNSPQTLISVTYYDNTWTIKNNILYLNGYIIATTMNDSTQEVETMTMSIAEMYVGYNLSGFKVDPSNNTIYAFSNGIKGFVIPQEFIYKVEMRYHLHKI